MAVTWKTTKCERRLQYKGNKSIAFRFNDQGCGAHVRSLHSFVLNPVFAFYQEAKMVISYSPKLVTDNNGQDQIHHQSQCPPSFRFPCSILMQSPRPCKSATQPKEVWSVGNERATCRINVSAQASMRVKAHTPYALLVPVCGRPRLPRAFHVLVYWSKAKEINPCHCLGIPGKDPLLLEQR